MSKLNFNYNNLSEREINDIKIFLKKGYLIKKVENENSLKKILDFINEQIYDYLNLKKKEDCYLFDKSHELVPQKKLNDFRLSIIQKINSNDWIRESYFELARQSIFTIIGNELAMQKRLNLSIQLPNDTGSLLNVHSDTWSGDSPYEVVVWLPLVDCYNTKSMYILPNDKIDNYCDNSNLFIEQVIERNNVLNSDNLYEKISTDVCFLKLNRGEVLVFNQTLPHGNLVNKEKETRWSMNCRFKALFTPYSEKKLGEFFEPLIIRPASFIGMNYDNMNEEN